MQKITVVFKDGSKPNAFEGITSSKVDSGFLNITFSNDTNVYLPMADIRYWHVGTMDVVQVEEGTEENA